MFLINLNIPIFSLASRSILHCCAFIFIHAKEFLPKLNYNVNNKEHFQDLSNNLQYAKFLSLQMKLSVWSNYLIFHWKTLLKVLKIRVSNDSQMDDFLSEDTLLNINFIYDATDRLYYAFFLFMICTRVKTPNRNYRLRSRTLFANRLLSWQFLPQCSRYLARNLAKVSARRSSCCIV